MSGFFTILAYIAITCTVVAMAYYSVSASVERTPETDNGILGCCGTLLMVVPSLLGADSTLAALLLISGSIVVMWTTFRFMKLSEARK